MDESLSKEVPLIRRRIDRQEEGAPKSPSLSSSTLGSDEATGDDAAEDVLSAISEAVKKRGSAPILTTNNPSMKWEGYGSDGPTTSTAPLPAVFSPAMRHKSVTTFAPFGGDAETLRAASGFRRRNSTGFADGLTVGANRLVPAESLRRDESEGYRPNIMSLRDAIQSRSVKHLETSLRGSNARQELMAKNAANGAGLLMLAVAVGYVPVLETLASAIKNQLGTTQLARQLRYEDDDERPLMFYAAVSSLQMFMAVKKLVKDTIGRAGLAEQLRHQCAKGTNVLMKASNDPGVFTELWALLKRTRCLDELMDEKDKEGRSWVLYAAEAGNREVFEKIAKLGQDVYTVFSATDNRGWSGFMYAARGQGAANFGFLRMLFKLCFEEAKDRKDLEAQLRRVVDDDDNSTLLMHAAIGGFGSYGFICRAMREAGCVDLPGGHDKGSLLLSWAAQGGDVAVLNAVAWGIKSGNFLDGVSSGRWFDVNDSVDGEADLLLNSIRMCAERRTGASLFLSAIESGTQAMIRAVAEGIEALVPWPKECWDILCGVSGNPFSVAASKSIKVFKETLRVLEGMVALDSAGLKPQIISLLLPEADRTPLVSAVYSEQPALFDEVLGHINAWSVRNQDNSLSGSEILRQVGHAMRDIGKEEKTTDQWISARMLAKVLEAAKSACKNNVYGYFDVTMLDDFVRLAVELEAFDHVRELLKIGCHLVTHFPALLSKIGIDERNTIECVILAITAASNPFVVCSIASQAIYEATVKRLVNHAALGRLQLKIGELSLELLEHLPHTVNGVGEELARGDPDLQPFYAIGKIMPSELLGFVVVGWMLEGSGQPNAPSESRLYGGENSLVQAVTSGPRALELLSEALVLDYLGMKFSRTLPRWHSQKPFERNINQAFYSYTHQAHDAQSSHDVQKQRVSRFQRLLLLLQGWDIKGNTLPIRTIFPGLQFTLAGIVGKPVSYYVVPAIRMAFIVMSYLMTIGLYLSCVSLHSQKIPPEEWVFYLLMLAVAWRETLEFYHASKSEPGVGVGASIERYFLDKWNFLDVTTVVFVFMAFAFRMMELTSGDENHLFLAQIFFASTAPLLFSRVLFLSQIGSALGPMTQVIFTMLTELVQFSLVLFLVMMGFAASFRALYGTNSLLVEQKLGASACNVNEHPIVVAFGTLGSALLTIFSAMLGEFEFEMFFDNYESDDGQDCGGVIYKSAGVAMLITYLVIMAVMLLNLLIAVLSTAHSAVQQNAAKEFQLARAKIILQSGEDVLNDVLPPPFNLIKPALGMVWPVGSGGSEGWDRSWEITTGAIHRTIFAVFVGLVALSALMLLWVVSFPLMAWKYSLWLSAKSACNGTDADEQSDQGNNSDFRPSLKRPFTWPSDRTKWPKTSSQGSSASRGGNTAKGNNDTDPTSRMTREERSLRSTTFFKEEDLEGSIEEIFFHVSATTKGRVSTAHALSLLVGLVYISLGAVLAGVSCFFVYPVLSIVLWFRGLFSVLQYVEQACSKKTPWERRQVDLGEDEEWSKARAHAIVRNRRYRTSNSSDKEFNVDALLKTTTGMTMEDLRQNMRNLKSVRRRRALGASLDAVLSQFPSEDNRL